MERQYIGARYVPKFADPVAWDANNSYDALTIVTYFNSSYTSRKPVPAGVEISNTEYWVCTSNFNAQLETLIELVNMAAKSYNTIAELTADIANIGSGEVVRVNGFYAKGDGGDSYIQIFDYQPTGLYITVGSKYGKPIDNGHLVPEMFGARADGLHDDSTIINGILAEYKYCYLNPDKEYLCENTINVNADMFINGNHSVMHTTAAIGVIMKNYDNSQDHTAHPVYLHDIKITGNGSNTLVSINKCLKAYIYNCEFINFNTGIDFVEGYEANIHDCHFAGGSAVATGIICESRGGDSLFENLILRECKTGIHTYSGGNYFNNIHAWILASSFVSGSNMIIDEAVGGLTNTYNNIYCDTYAHLITKIGTGLSLFDKVSMHVNTSIIDDSEITNTNIIVFDNDEYINFMGGKVCLYNLTITNTRPSLYILANRTDVYIPISLEKVSYETMSMLNDFNGLDLFTVQNGVTLGETSKISIINNELHGFLDATLPADWTIYKRALSVKNGGINFPDTLQIMRRVDAAESTVVSGTTIGDYIQIRGGASSHWYVYLNASVRGLQ